MPGRLEQQQSQSAGALPSWHGIDMAQRRMLATLSDEELRALKAAVEAFQAGLELTPEQETLVLRCQEVARGGFFALNPLLLRRRRRRFLLRELDGHRLLLAGAVIHELCQRVRCLRLATEAPAILGLNIARNR